MLRRVDLSRKGANTDVVQHRRSPRYREHSIFRLLWRGYGSKQGIWDRLSMINLKSLFSHARTGVLLETEAMQTRSYKPVHGEVRKTPARPPCRINRARISLGSVALITFSLGFVFGSGWWVFTGFAIFTAFVVGREPSAKLNVNMSDNFLDQPRAYPTPLGQELHSRLY